MNIPRLIASIRPDLPHGQPKTRDSVVNAYVAALEAAIKARKKSATSQTLVEIDLLYLAKMELRYALGLDKDGVAERMKELREYKPDDGDEAAQKAILIGILNEVGLALKK